MDALDGNAVADTLAELFGSDLTDATTICIGCGDHRPVGTLIAYVGGPGIVLRCRGCLTVQIQIVRTPRRVRIDLRGARLLELVVPTSQR